MREDPRIDDDRVGFSFVTASLPIDPARELLIACRSENFLYVLLSIAE